MAAAEPLKQSATFDPQAVQENPIIWRKATQTGIRTHERLQQNLHIKTCRFFLHFVAYVVVSLQFATTLAIATGVFKKKTCPWELHQNVGLEKLVPKKYRRWYATSKSLSRSKL